MMKRHLLVAAVVLLSCGGCVGYYSDPYTYYPYSSYSSYYPYYRYAPYRPYYPYYSYPAAYRPPAVYYAPGWSVFYPSLYFGYRHHHYRGPYYHRAPYHRGGPYYHRGGGRR